MSRFLSVAVLLTQLAPAGVAHAKDTTRRPLPDPVPDGARQVTLAVGDGPIASWELGWALAHPAEGEPTFVRRPSWGALAAAIATVPTPTPERLAEVRLVDGAEVLIATRREAEVRLVTLLLPAQLLRPQTGKLTFGLDSSFARARTTTTELTTWPLTLSLEAWDEPKPDRRLEGHISLGRELVEERTRSAARDDNGDPIPFRDSPKATLRDARQAHARGAWFVTTGREEYRRELGVTLEASWEEDEADLVESRVVTLLGAEWRRTSEVVDDRSVRAAFKVGATRSRYLLRDSVLDESGAEIGTTTTVEQHNLPVWQVELGATSPLMRSAGLTVILLETSASWQQSFEGSGGSEQRPDRLESLGVLDLGLIVRTPIGAEVGVGLHFEHRELPGEAGERIDDLSWSTGARTSLRLAF